MVKRHKNRMSKIILSLILVLLVMVSVPSEVKAASFWEEVFGGGDEFLQMGEEQALKGDLASDEKTSEIITILYNTLSTLGVIVVVAIGGVLGIKFMTASAEDKAKIQESMVPYVVGSIVIFGAFTIWNLFIQIFSNIS